MVGCLPKDEPVTGDAGADVAAPDAGTDAGPDAGADADSDTGGGLPDVSGTNEAPSAPEVAISPREPLTGDALAVAIAVESTDPDGDAVTYQYRWLRDGVVMPELTEDTVPPEETAKGEIWEVIVTPSDGQITGDSARAEVVVLNTAPTATLAVEPAEPTTVDALTAALTAEDADDDALESTITWTLEGEDVTESGDTLSADLTARGQTWTVEALADTGDEVSLVYAWFVNDAPAGDGPTIDGEAFGRGDAVRCVATPNDGIEDGAAVESAAVTVSNTPPVLASAAITPDPKRDRGYVLASAAGQRHRGDNVRG